MNEGTSRSQAPKAPQSVEETGLGLGFLSDLALKMIYFGGEMAGQEVSDAMALPFVHIIDEVLGFLKRESMVVISGGGEFGEQALRYKVTERGAARAREALLRSQYVGPAPVPLRNYTAVVQLQTIAGVTASAESVREAFSHLVLDGKVVGLLGPAINSGRSIFIYGEPGGGKTTIAEAIAGLLGGSIYVPHAVDISGHIVKVFEEQSHRPVTRSQDASDPGMGMVRRATDQRWVECHRPAVVVGGEMTLASLDLVYDPVVQFYEAPLQMKANGGMLLIDDFGRQMARPVDLLNRWMVPLEKRIDFLTLHTGQKVQLPFDVLIVFSTNIEPKDLVDEAFLRRIRHKVEIGPPTVEQFRTIWQRVCDAREIGFDEDTFQWLVEEWYGKEGREFRGVHPRDLVEQVLDIAKYRTVAPAMTKELLDDACLSYFVRL